MIRPPIWMAEKEPKCIGSACRRPGAGCARKDIVYTPGRPLGDFSIPNGYSIPECSPANHWVRWIDPATAVKPVAANQPRDWIGS